MNTTKLTMSAVGAVALVAVGIAVFEFRAAANAEDSLASANHQREETRARIEGLKNRVQAETKRAQAVEADNALLLAAIQKAQAEKIAKAASAAAPLTREAVDERFRKARALVKDGDAETALRELLWCYDEGFRRVGSSQLGSVASALGELGQRYPAALAALRERLEKARQQVLAGPGGSDAVSEVAYLSHALMDDQMLLVLYDLVPAGDRRRQSLSIYGFDQFITAQRYDDALVGQQYAMMSAQFEMTTAERPLPANITNPEPLRAAQRNYAITSSAKNIEVLAGVGDLEHARALTARLLAYDSSDATKATVQQHLTRAGHPELLAPAPKP